MESKYSFEKKEGYLNLLITGTYSRADFLSYPTIIKEKCEEEKIYHVLFNALGLEGTNLPTLDRFVLGEEVAKALGAKIKLAVVWRQKDINKFAENVAINRGGNVCVLGDIETAKKWLLSI